MRFQTQLRDCLFLNWSLPASALPEPPPGLRWEKVSLSGSDRVFASALLFRQEGLRLAALPLPRLSYPQLNLRLYVVDEDDVPSVLFLMMLVPPWVLPAAKWMAKQRVAAARFDFPALGRCPEHATRWRVHRGGELRISTSLGVPSLEDEAAIGSWKGLVDRLRKRDRGYSWTPRGLRRVEARQPRVEFVPLRAEVEACDLLPPRIGDREVSWPELHSAFFCPCLPYVFELGPSLEVSVPRPQPASAGWGNCTHGATRRIS